MNGNLEVSIGPHLKDKISTRNIMWAVVACLIPSGCAGVYIFGLKALYLIIAAVLSGVVTEAVILLARKRDLSAILDGSAVITGLLLAYNLPPDVPVWMAVIGSFFAIAIGKQIFGGLGHNIFNPALAGRAFLMVSWPVYMTTWSHPRWAADAVTSATPLGLYKHAHTVMGAGMSYWDIFIGNRGGCIGEVSVVMLLLGASYLFLRRYITWHIPVTFIGTVALFSWIFNGTSGLFTGDALFFVMAGGLILGALFMATDYVTSPISVKGRIIFGVGCGFLTFVIRKFAGYPEGVSYAILIMNAATPIIDRMTFPKWFGWRKL